MSIIIEMWRLASQDIGFEIVTPYVLDLPCGAQILVELLVKDFGPPNGMLIVKSFDSVKSFTDEIINMGYGVSVVGDSYGKEPYDRQSFIEMLKDWGWNRDGEDSPF